MVVFLACLFAPSVPAQTPPGTSIQNQAALSYTTTLGQDESTLSNPVEVITTAAATASALALDRIVAPTSGDVSVPVDGTECVLAGGFVTLPDPVLLGGGSIDPAVPRPLAATALYHAGEPVFVTLSDPDQNLDFSVREQVLVSIRASPGGEQEQLRLLETAANSGLFAGYIQSAGGAVTPGDCILQVGVDGGLDASYVDPGDDGDTSTARAAVDPVSRVFDSRGGSLVDGVLVRIVDEATGQPAMVLGRDGVSSYPSEVRTGTETFDSGGNRYDFGPGAYQFPIVPPGDYRLIAEPPEGFASPSTESIETLQQLPGAPWVLDDASFGMAFSVGAGASAARDLPIDPDGSQLFLSKKSTSGFASVGDFIQYTLTLENANPTLTLEDVFIVDILPPGFRYLDDSAHRDGTQIGDPSVSSDGSTLSFPVGMLAPGQQAHISYAVEVTVGAREGRAINRASALAADGMTSNQATASVEIIEGLLRSKSIIMGRVMQGDCRSGQDYPGVAGIRLYLEDGRYVVTDDEGRYHMEGIDPGGHVVQLDTATLPAHLELARCESLSVVGSNALSRFVDLQPGSLWRAEYYLREKTPPGGEVSLRLGSRVDEGSGGIRFGLDLAGTGVPVADLSVLVLLPRGLELTGELGELTPEPRMQGPSATFDLGDKPAQWEQRLEFSARLTASEENELITRAIAGFASPGEGKQRTPVAENRLGITPSATESVDYVVTPHFDVLKTELKEEDREILDALIAEWRDAHGIRLRAVGHSDSDRIAPRNRHIFADNYSLSLARANSVANYVAGDLALSAGQIEVIGKGPDEPIADEREPGGKARNRRVQLSLEGLRTIRLSSVAVLAGDSGWLATETVGGFDAEPFGVPDGVTGQDRASPESPVRFKQPEVLAELLPGIDWLAPDDGFQPVIPSIRVAVKHHPGQQVELRVNGAPVGPLNFDGSFVSPSGSVTASMWRGVDLVDGQNRLQAVVTDDDGNVVRLLERDVHFAGGPVSATMFGGASRLSADGRNRPVIAVRMFDHWGKPAREGTIGRFRVDPPYRSWWEVESLTENQLVAVADRSPVYTVSRDGIAYIELEPTSRSGEVTLHFEFPDNPDQVIRAWLTAAERDWILVGFGETTVGYETLNDNMVAASDAGFHDEFYQDNRLAFFAKGAIKGETLLTLAYDSKRNRGEAERSLHGIIDPNRYYAIYGDGTETRYEAASQEKLYLKIERRQFYAMFGDFETGLTLTELSRYSRSLNGLKSEYRGEQLSYNAFASETDQAFVHDEINGDGTSGLYQLSRYPILINSDKLRIEVRDRFHSERVLESRSLAPYLDYTLDFERGTVFFKQPVPSRDQNFNPVYIVADYEARDTRDSALVAGGRTAFHTVDQNLEVGVTGIYQDTRGDEGHLVGGDLRYQVTGSTEFRAEVATSHSEPGSEEFDGDAWLAEIAHRGERTEAYVYYGQQDEDFGLGQEQQSEAGMRKMGVDGRLQLNGWLSLVGGAYREDNLETDDQRDVVESQMRYEFPGGDASLGLLNARDKIDGEEFESSQLFFGARKQVFDDLLTLHGGGEINFASGDANGDFPNRAIVGAEYRVMDNATFFSEYEYSEDSERDTSMTRVGVRATPWSQGQLQSTVSQGSDEFGPRTFATLGLIQGWQATEQWYFDVGLDQAKNFGSSDAPRVNEQAPPASGAIDGDFVALALGALYRGTDWTLTSRLEQRYANSEDRVSLTTGLFREQREGRGFAASSQILYSDYEAAPDTLDADLRLDWAWRPSDSPWIFLDRLDLIYEEISGPELDFDSWRLVNNLNGNWQLDVDRQLAFQLGAKYQRSNTLVGSYTGFTDLLGAQFRQGFHGTWDYGLHAQALHSWESDVTQYRLGLDLGVLLLESFWVTLGYNFAGFQDEDFSHADYTARGPYIRLRLKADQQSVNALRGGLSQPK